MFKRKPKNAPTGSVHIVDQWWDMELRPLTHELYKDGVKGLVLQIFEARVAQENAKWAQKLVWATGVLALLTGALVVVTFVRR